MAQPEPVSTSLVLNALRELSALATPIIGGVVALIVYIWNSRNREIARLAKDALDSIRQEREDREKADVGIVKLIEDLDHDFRAGRKEVIDTFREGIREERQFRTDVLKHHGESIKELYNRVNGLSREAEGLSRDIKNVEKICEKNHRG